MARGYTMITEQAGPRELVEHVVCAERSGFDFSVIADHYLPRLESQGHSPYAWSVLGAAAQATTRIPLMTYVTCPTTRYHPAVVAQKAATMQLLSEGRFRLGLGSGENLDEHVVGGGRPAAHVRPAMPAEAVEIIRALFAGGNVNHHGAHFDVENATLWDLPDEVPSIGVAVSGDLPASSPADSRTLSSPPSPSASSWKPSTGTAAGGKPRIGRLPVCYDSVGTTVRSTGTRRSRAHTTSSAGRSASGVSTSTCRGGPGSPGPPSTYAPRTSPGPSRAATTSESSWTPYAPAWRPVSPRSPVIQVGGDHQLPFPDWAEKKLLPALREL
ncbi:TIGR03557 family F420-dependent LLM class oxidoreductase [Streptomyces sp. NBC_01142]|uniref:TIGR03557 family F420-dependent LLM class oxidoreductase n=1 Tax=Streptomyces sp. NBC_01142 TaxID=2975865 RepID=UPI002250DD95|nr:TIGR03557 family F420-dependent LLM class oxidoreductase [Streptomyces sp. NBC_01142]MCX4824991.1 TIGR03557 family F420-dependent LLM class oxidoreductase [Streptomyces sp. NBC_01142]